MRPRLGWPATAAPSLLAALTTWVALWSWAGFVQRPGGYLGPALGVVLLVAVTGMLLRAAHLRSGVVVAAQVVVLAVTLTHGWAADTALGGWLPTPSSVQEVVVVLGRGVSASRAYRAPVSAAVPQIFPMLVAAGSVVAVLVDFLACGLRRVPLAGLPLLAIYTAPVSILPSGVPWWIFGLTAVSFLALLAADEGSQLLSWGRRVPMGETIHDTGGGAVGSQSIRSSARRIGLTATGLALVAPLVIPTFSGGFLPGNGPGGRGNGGAVDISNPLVTLRRDLVRGRDVNLLTVHTDAPDPSYLRISVLDSFDGRTWQPSTRNIPVDHRADGPVARPPGLGGQVPRREVHYRISIDQAFRSAWLPTPYPVTAIHAPGDWRYDSSTLDFVSAKQGVTTAGLEYSLTALDVLPRVEDLLVAHPPPESVLTAYTELPDSVPPRVAALARRVTAGADTKFAEAVRLQRWFRVDGGFRYSLAPAAGTGTNDLLDFLSTGPGGRVGYCEQFAAAMAVMGRTLGIPSRVVVGFLRPSRTGPDEYVYSAHDLHAWPEMYFSGVGWVRFEPTPGARASTVPGYTAGQLNVPEPAQAPSVAAPTALPQGLPHNRRQVEITGVPTTATSPAGRPWRPVALGAGAAALLLLVPRCVRAAVRRRRWAAANTPPEAAEAGWRELRDTALDLRLPWNDALTLRTTARTVAKAFGRSGSEKQQDAYARGGPRGSRANPEAAHALERLVRDVERARYAREQVDGRSLEEVSADVGLCTEALRAGTTAKRRRLATWLPASLLRNGAWRSLSPLQPTGEVPLEVVGVDRAS